MGIGDLGLAYQAFKIATTVDPNHAESFTNLGVLELRKGNVELARSNFGTAQRIAPHLYEPLYNGALLAFKLGEFEKAHALASESGKVYPGHSDTQELLAQLKKHFSLL